MEEKDVQRLLDMLYGMIDEAKSVAFSSDKCIIVRDEALDLLDEIRAKLPLELKKAQELIAARSEYVAGAKKEAESMLRQAELDAGQCLTGAHKDDLEIYINGNAARSFASQGQTRTAALSLKLAEREIFLAETGEYPILLLDDVLSELDAKRQEFVLNSIGGGQTLITCCEDEGISKRTGGKVLFVEKGRIK